MQFSSFISHRGANQVLPQNTMEAFQKAIDVGCQWIELDVQLSADETLFIFHDNNAKKLTGFEGDLTARTWSEIAELSVLKEQFPQKNYRIPALEQYLQWMSENPQIYTNLEIKGKAQPDPDYEKQLVHALLQLLAKFPQLHSRILLSSFSKHILALVCQAQTKIATEFLLDVKNWDEQQAHIFTEVKADYDRWGCVALGVNDNVLTVDRINRLKQSFGILLCYSLTLLDDEAVLNLLNSGVDSVFIDHVTLLEKESDI